MASVPCFPFRFTPSWMMTALTLVVSLLLTSLGFWQLAREHEKSIVLQTEQEMAGRDAVDWQVSSPMPLPFQRIKVSGHYLSTVFLLDNQHHHHQFGYNVLSPLMSSDGSVVLVDRGWVAGDPSRQIFPQIHTPETVIKIHGRVYFPSNKQWVLGPEVERKNPQLSLLERLDTKMVSKILQKKVYPFIIRLDKGDEYGFVRQWVIVSMPPQRHLAYAVQWFSMALTVFVIYIALNLKKK